MRRKYDAAAEISLAQHGVAVLGERKVGQAVVGEVDARLLMPQPAVALRERGSIGDHGCNTVPLEQPLFQQELGIEKLPGRFIAHDRNDARTTDATVSAPFLQKHFEEARFGTGGVHRLRDPRFHLGTAGALCASRVLSSPPPALVLISMRRGPSSVTWKS